MKSIPGDGALAGSTREFTVIHVNVPFAGAALRKGDTESLSLKLLMMWRHIFEAFV